VSLKTEIEAGAAALPTERLEAELCQLAAHISAATCRWLLLVAEYDKRGAWTSWECHSCAHWLSLKTGLGIHTARQHVRVARRLCDLPRITEEFSRGALSFSKVRALVRLAIPGTEVALVQLAAVATASQLERLARALPPEPDDDPEAERRRQDKRRVRWAWDDEGNLVLSAVLTCDEGAAVIKALEASMAEVRRDRTEHRTSAADGLVRMAEKALAATDADPSGADRNMVILHSTVAALAEDDGTSHLDLGPGILAETARRLACDASVVEAITDGDGVPLSIGRKSQKVPTSMRRALHLRDHSCRFPGCTNKFGLDAHHIMHWAKGGATSSANMVLLCRHHHRAVHEGPWNIEASADQTATFTKNGRSQGVSTHPPSHPQAVEEMNHAAGLEIDAETGNGHQCGERMDFPYTCGVLAGNREVMKNAIPGSSPRPCHQPDPWSPS
jgi:hypothetical protein